MSTTDAWKEIRKALEAVDIAAQKAKDLANMKNKANAEAKCKQLLPPEIRNIIYEYATGYNDIHVRVERTPFSSVQVWRPQPGMSKIFRGLPRTSHQLRRETALLVYKHSGFRIRLDDLASYFAVIGQDAARLIRHLVIEQAFYSIVKPDKRHLFSELVCDVLRDMQCAGDLERVVVVLLTVPFFAADAATQPGAQRLTNEIKGEFYSPDHARQVAVECLSNEHAVGRF